MQLLDERFDEIPDGVSAGNNSALKIEREERDAKLVGLPGENEKCEWLPEGDVGFTEDIRISFRLKLSENSSLIALAPRLGGKSAYRVVFAGSWVRVYRASPPGQSDLDAELLGETRFESPLLKQWSPVAVTMKGEEITVSVDGKEVLSARGKRAVSGAGVSLRISGGRTEIDDFVATSI